MRRRWAYLGNHQPGVPNPWSTETHLASSIELCGHEVTRIQEGEVRAVDVPDLVKGHDIFLHTQTYGLAVSGGTVEERSDMLARIKDLGIPTVGFHLDLWFGLDRSDQLATEPFFRVDHLFSADGDHDTEFRSYNINHHWLPPGVYGPECYYGRSRPEFMSDVAFVGSWQGHYHKESTHRFELVDWLRRNIPRRRVRFWPAPGSRAVRGADLNDLYASVKVVVGDSCFPHGHTGLYMSDRVMETPGRGGLLIHPSTPGVTLTQPDMPTWPIWDWNALGVTIDYLLTHEKEREEIRRTVHEHTRAHHVYDRRVEQIVEVLEREGAL